MESFSNLRPVLPSGVKLEQNVYVTMRDGVKIAVDIYRPEAEGRYPGILSTSPYLKEIQPFSPEVSHSIEAGGTFSLVLKGYVHIIAQIRGSGMSQGQWDWFDSVQQKDWYELVEWIAKQPWCTGNVGMMGDSYFAMSQWLTAVQQPPHLKCIAPFDGVTDFYRAWHEGGFLRNGFVGEWGLDTIAQCLWPGPVEGKLPPVNFMVDTLNQPDDGPYYWERSSYPRLEKIEVPVLNLVVGSSRLHSRTQLRAHSLVKSPKKLVIMPSFGFSSNVVMVRCQPLQELLLRWFDHWLKGINTGIMDEPPVAICDRATEEWRYENEYPLARTKWTKFYLRSNAEGPSTSPPFGLLSLETPKDEKPDSYVTPEAWERLHAGKPVLTYATPPLKEDLRVWGPLSITFYASSTTTDTGWFVRVGDVSPDGQLTPLVMGLLKASYREVDAAKSAPGQPWHPYQKPVRPEPNKIYEYQIEITPTFHTFRKGHKLWVHIASHDFEYMGVHNTVYAWEMMPLPSKNTIYHDSAHPSHILLPLIPDAPVIKPVGPPISQIKFPLAETALPLPAESEFNKAQQNKE